MISVEQATVNLKAVVEAYQRWGMDTRRGPRAVVRRRLYDLAYFIGKLADRIDPWPS